MVNYLGPVRCCAYLKQQINQIHFSFRREELGGENFPHPQLLFQPPPRLLPTKEYMLKKISKFCVKMWHLFCQVFDKYFVKTFIKKAIFSNIAITFESIASLGSEDFVIKHFSVRRFQVIKLSDIV